jgi:trehalose synthase
VDGETGFLVDTVDEAAEKTLHLLEHTNKAEEMGKNGKEHVKTDFLVTRHLKDYLKLFLQLT